MTLKINWPPRYHLPELQGRQTHTDWHPSMIFQTYGADRHKKHYRNISYFTDQIFSPAGLGRGKTICPTSRKNFAKRCSFRSDKTCRGVALAKTGCPNEKSLLGNAPGISQPVRACPVECGAYSSGVGRCGLAGSKPRAKPGQWLISVFSSCLAKNKWETNWVNHYKTILLL